MIDRKLTPDTIQDIIRHGPPDDLRVLPIALSMDPPDDIDVESICLRLAQHPDPFVRGNAVLGLGHLARVLGKLDPERVKPVLRAALDDAEPWVRGHAASAISDVGIFLGWKFRRTHPRTLPEGPYPVTVVAAYRTLILIDDEGQVLVERGGADPRGLSAKDDWRLPAFSLTRPRSPRAEATEALWERRRGWRDPTTIFQERLVVRAPYGPGAEDNGVLEWVQLSLQAIEAGPAESPWPAEGGEAQAWLSYADLMTEASFGAHDRYALALFDEVMAAEHGRRIA